MRKLVLASQSPRRAKLLEEAHLEFIIQSTPIDEEIPKGIELEKAPEFIAKAKALAQWHKYTETEQNEKVILSGDTVVIFQNKIMSKPQDKKEAIDFLNRLSDNVHQVITGVCIIGTENLFSFSTLTNVYFRKLEKLQIEYYVDQFRPFDKAGAYAIQEWIGLTGIEKIEGDFFNVMGLPVSEVLHRLRQNFPDAMHFRRYAN